MSHISLIMDGHTVTVTGPDPQALLAKMLGGKPAPPQKTLKLQKARVSTTRVANAYLGRAVGVLLAGEVECIVIAASQEDAQLFMDTYNIQPGDARFSTSVAMVQQKDVAIESD